MQEVTRAKIFCYRPRKRSPDMDARWPANERSWCVTGSMSISNNLKPRMAIRPDSEDGFPASCFARETVNGDSRCRGVVRKGKSIIPWRAMPNPAQ